MHRLNHFCWSIFFERDRVSRFSLRCRGWSSGWYFIFRCGTYGRVGLNFPNSDTTSKRKVATASSAELFPRFGFTQRKGDQSRVTPLDFNTRWTRFCTAWCRVSVRERDGDADGSKHLFVTYSGFRVNNWLVTSQGFEMLLTDMYCRYGQLLSFSIERKKGA